MLGRNGESRIDTFLSCGHVLHTVVDPPLESVEVDGPRTVVSPRYQQYCVGQLVQQLPSPGGEARVHLHCKFCELVPNFGFVFGKFRVHLHLPCGSGEQLQGFQIGKEDGQVFWSDVSLTMQQGHLGSKL